jgi:hypothetical protein
MVVNEREPYFTPSGREDMQVGVIFTRPPVAQPRTVPPELQDYLEQSHVSPDVLEAVRGTLVPLSQADAWHYRGR